MRLPQRILAGGATLLITLMPFHAFLSVVLGSALGSRDIQAWKEIVAVMMTGSALALFVTSKKIRRQLWSAPNAAAAVFALIALTVSWREGVLGGLTAWFGIKTDLVYPAIFVSVQAAAASDRLRERLTLLLLAGAGVAAASAILFIWLPPGFLAELGYSAQTIRPLQAIAGGARRAFGTLGGPNQLGAFLILPICLLAGRLIKDRRRWHLPLMIVLLSALILTFSRSALIGTFVGVTITAALSLPPKRAKQVLAAAAAVLMLGAIAVIELPAISPQLRYYIQHEYGLDTDKGSDDERLRGLRQGVELFRDQPSGHGLGTAGPASFRGPNAVIPENYYLQLAIEAGIAGLLAYLAFELLVTRQLWRQRHHAALAAPLLGALSGVFLVNQFLHGWADSSTALTFWTLAGLAVAERDV